MLYSEFVAGTGCRETDHNYQVYKELEIIYMNTDCTKEHIYEMGRKLVDNSKTEAELKLEAEIKEEIESNKNMIEVYKKEVAWKKNLIEADPYDKEFVKDCKRMIKYYNEQIKFHRNKINELKWVLA